MKVITFSDPHRQKHFDFFKSMNHPHFNITVHVELTHFLPFLEQAGFKFTPSIVFVIAKAANAIKEFKWRIRDEQVVEHDFVHPSYTVNTNASSVFSFCTVPFQQHMSEFLKDARKIEKAMQQNPSFEDEPGRDDYLFMSASGNTIKMPLSVQAHHALVNGKEAGDFIELLQQYLHQPGNL